MIALILSLLDDEQLLRLYEKVERKRLMVVWPAPPDEEEQKALLKDLHMHLLSAGYDRHLAQVLNERDQQVRRQIAELHKQTGGILKG